MGPCFSDITFGTKKQSQGTRERALSLWCHIRSQVIWMCPYSISLTSHSVLKNNPTRCGKKGHYIDPWRHIRCDRQSKAKGVSSAKACSYAITYCNRVQWFSIFFDFTIWPPFMNEIYLFWDQKNFAHASLKGTRTPFSKRAEWLGA